MCDAWEMGGGEGEKRIRRKGDFGDGGLTAHSYKILNFPFGDFLSAGYAKMPP